MLRDFAKRLGTLEHPSDSTNLPTAIFGTAGSLSRSIDSRPHVRVGLWPCISQDTPELAMGLFTLLAYHLERWQDVRVYRVFIRLEEETPQPEWTMDRSQFGVDDWEIDGLDETAALWGSLKNETGVWQLEISGEDDLADDEIDSFEMSYKANTLAELIAVLPQAARDIAAHLSLDDDYVFPAYEACSASDTRIKDVLSVLFAWERRLLLMLWGDEWLEEHMMDEHDHLVQVCEAVGGDFGAWSAVSAIARAMLPGFNPIGELLADLVESDVMTFSDSDLPAVQLGHALFRLAFVDEAYDLLENAVEEKPQRVLAWRTLASLYALGGRAIDGVDTYQRAIEIEAVDDELYIEYAQLMSQLDFAEVEVEEYILIDPDEIAERWMIWEAIEAYQAVLDRDPDNADVVYAQLKEFAENNLQDKRFWPRFEHLVALDSTGNLVRSVVDMLSSLADISPAVAILQKALDKDDQRYDLHLSLAALYLIDEAGDKAKPYLKKARELTEDPLAYAEIDRMLLFADNPEAELRLSEISALADAGKSLSTEDVEFLEDAIEQVPTFVDGYVLLARAYLTWKEPSTALETLLDGNKRFPHDTRIIQLLSAVLWTSGEYDLALEYLKKGLEQHPNHVPLLAMTGQFLFEIGQENEAKEFLERAERINPLDSSLRQARVTIAHLAESKR